MFTAVKKLSNVLCLVALCITLSVPAMAKDKVDRKSTRLNSSHGYISYAVFCLKKKLVARAELGPREAPVFVADLPSRHLVGLPQVEHRAGRVGEDGHPAVRQVHAGHDGLPPLLRPPPRHTPGSWVRPPVDGGALGATGDWRLGVVGLQCEGVRSGVEARASGVVGRQRDLVFFLTGAAPAKISPFPPHGALPA